MELARRFISRHGVLIAGICVGLLIAGNVLAHAARLPTELAAAVSAQIGFLFAFLAIPIVGAILVRRVPENVVGYILIFGGVVLGGMTICSGYVFFAAERDLPFVRFAAVAHSGLDPFLNLVLPLLFLYFPTGRLLSRRWGRAMVPVFIGMGYFLVINFLVPPIDERYPIPDIYMETDAARPAIAMVAQPMYLLFTLGLGIAVVSQFVRYRRASHQERLQIKWFAVAAAGVIVCEVLLGLLRPGGGNTVGVFLVYSIFAAALPISIGIAVLKHRLYQIDVVINKTIVYGGLASFVTALYTGLVVGASSLLGSRIGQGTSVSVAATATVAILFAPVKSRLERIADRIVYGGRSTPFEVLAGFSDRIASSISVEDVLPQMAEAGGRGLRAEVCRVGLLLPDGEWVHAWWPREAQVDIFDRVLPVLHQGSMVGQIEISKRKDDPVGSDDEELLAVLASQAGPAMHNVRLASELRQRIEQISAQASELAESRRRLVAVQDEERRRLERDIHDGVQQDMIGLSLKLQEAKRASGDPRQTTAALDELDSRLNETVDRLRSLARGVFPSLLGDHGVAAALQAHVQKHFPEAELVFGDAVIGRRFDAAFESTIYFCCLEALQNVSRHAPGASVRVELKFVNGKLTFAVADDGPGFDPSAGRTGSGLMNLRDRMAVVGGTLQITSVPGKGTNVCGTIDTIFKTFGTRK
jgi:signal transduction histidine kinase